MESAFLVYDVDVVWLELHDPLGVQGWGVFHFHQGLQRGMIGDDLE